jgi:hypothetical protein
MRDTSELLAAQTFFRVGLISNFGDFKIGFICDVEGDDTTEGDAAPE